MFHVELSQPIRLTSFQINSLSAQGDHSERDFSCFKPRQEHSEFETECK